MVNPPAMLSYNPSQYRMRRVRVSLKSIDIWTSWLMDLGPNEILWYVPWYGVDRFFQTLPGYSCLFVLGFTHSTWCYPSRVLRQMGIDQTVPLLDGLRIDAPITSRMVKLVMRAWVRDHRLTRPLPNPTLARTSPEYDQWLKTNIWPVERDRRITLLGEIEGWGVGKEKDKVESAPTIVPELVEVRESSPEAEHAPRRRRVA